MALPSTSLKTDKRDVSVTFRETDDVLLDGISASNPIDTPVAGCRMLVLLQSGPVKEKTRFRFIRCSPQTKKFRSRLHQAEIRPIEAFDGTPGGDIK